MKTSLIRLALALLAAVEAAPAALTLYFQLFMHCEEPHVPDTPNFKTMTAAVAGDATRTDSYVHWRNNLKSFADMCYARGIKFNYQSDWGFLEGCWQWEVKTPISGIKTNTGNLTIIQYLESLGFEVDAHSHQGSGYSYADVAFLVGKCGGRDARVIGGHRWDPSSSTALDYAQLTAAAGVAPTKYTSSQPIPANRAPNWFPQLLVAAAATDHMNEPHVSGMWRPNSASDFHSPSASASAMPAIDGWSQDLNETWRLIQRLENGEIAPGTQLWTSQLAVNHRDIVDDTYLTVTARGILDTLKRWQDAGHIRTTTFRANSTDNNDMLDHIWPNTFGGGQHIYQRPSDNVSVSLNWQDFYFKAESAAYLERILDLHEASRVPLDVFFTTWQTDVIADEHPALMARLQSSALVAQGYHVRPPKPYASGFEWGTLQTSTDAAVQRSTIENYESHRLNPDTATSYATAVPDTSASGGFARITALQGYAPICVGALAATSPVNLLDVGNAYFHDPDNNPANGNGGAKMAVLHSPPVNLGSRWTHPDTTNYPDAHLFYRPEHCDWKLIRMAGFNPLVTGGVDQDPQPVNLAGALAVAHATASSGGSQPWFVGVKLHDNDLFADQSAWNLVWPNANDASWSLARLNAGLRKDVATQEARFALYQAIVLDAAAQRGSVNLMNTFDTMSLLQEAQPRPVGLSRTRIAELPDVGSVLAEISGGGLMSGQSVSYELIAGDGSEDNADFSISGTQLLAARRLSYDEKAVRRLRVRWKWIDAADNATVLASGERPLALALAGTFRIRGVTAGSSGVEITVPTDAGAHYTLQSSTDLSGWSDEDGVDAVQVLGTGGTVTLRDAYPAGSRKFYRVVRSP